MVQADVGRAEAHLRSARALPDRDGPRSLEPRGRDGDYHARPSRGAAHRTTHAIRLACRWSTRLQRRRRHRDLRRPSIQRYFQDIHVISQHLQSRLAHYELVGRHWLGLPVDEARL